MLRKTKDLNKKNDIINIVMNESKDQIGNFVDKFKQQARQEYFDAVEKVNQLKASKSNILSRQIRYKQGPSNKELDPADKVKSKYY